MPHLLAPGMAVPWFQARALDGNPRYVFDTAAGRWILMLLMGSGAREPQREALQLVQQNRDLFDDEQACFFGVTVDPSDASEGRIARQLPGIRWFLDYDGAISTLLGAAEADGGAVHYAPHWLLLDPMLRVRGIAPLRGGAEIIAELRRLVGQSAEPEIAPVLVVPEVFPPELCRQLIGLYERHGGAESGFMREENGLTVRKLDPHQKRRADYQLQDEPLMAALNARLFHALMPMIRRAFQFEATRIERFIVACYDAEEGGHFRAHRDNTTKGTAHRKFACTINLNSEDYEGGDLCFPEFGRRRYRASTGGAVVFSCSLLHEAAPVTRGRRYAFLPFFYDDESAQVRERNQSYLAPEPEDAAPMDMSAA